MQQYEIVRAAIVEKARAERLYIGYALALGVLLALAGTIVVVAGAGDHLDILVRRNDLEARFINASPGVVLWLAAGTIFWVAKPRRLEADASHASGQAPLKFGHGSRAEGEDDKVIEVPVGTLNADIERQLRTMLESEIAAGGESIGKITRMSEDRLYQLTENLEAYLRRETKALRKLLGQDPAAEAITTAEDRSASDGKVRVFYQSAPKRDQDDNEGAA